MRRWHLASALAVLALGAVLVLRPLVKDRDFPASVPSPRALFSTVTIPLEPDSQACFDDVTIEPRSEQARFKVGTEGRRGAPLLLELQGEAYRAAIDVPGGYGDNVTLRAPVTPPSRATLVRVCFRNLGRTRVQLYASADRTRSRSIASVDGKPLDRSVWFAFYERRPASFIARLPDIFDRMSAFRPEPVGPWLLWPLALLFALGVPAGAVWACHRALQSDDEREGPPQD
jgi:hypothetical protein